MRLAILFWGYKDVALCANRLRLLRRLNRGVPLYFLYGGRLADAESFELALGGLVDDFFVFSGETDAHWKWRHGDRMIADWYLRRGHSLPFDTVFIAQWDLILLEPVAAACARLQPDELLLPGLRPVREVLDWWHWTQPGTSDRREYDRFAEHLRRRSHDVELLCCQFVVACLPRSFLTRYAAIDEPLLGFLEYKLPTYAQIFGHRFCTSHPFQVLWQYEPARPAIHRITRTLSAQDEVIPDWLVYLHSSVPGGRRAFHPVHSIYPEAESARLARAAQSALGGIARTALRRLPGRTR